MSSKIYCIMVLGRAPALLTELMWWLVERENARVVGLEVWTTASLTTARTGGAQLIEALTEGRMWEALLAALGEQENRVPPLPAEPVIVGPNDPISTTEGAFNVVRFERDGQPIGDVRNQDDAGAISALLHERVRLLRTELDEDVDLVGSLAGGRKTMSAALQGAFQLQARARDRLLHVLTHPRIEDPANGVQGSFVVPNQDVAEKLGIPVEEQVLVYDVPFAPMRELLLESDLPGDQIRRDFDRLDYDGLIGTLRRVLLSDEPITAHIDDGLGDRAHWQYTILAGREVIETIGLGDQAGETLAALVSLGPEGADARMLQARLASGGGTHGGHAAGAPISPPEQKGGSWLRKRMERLAGELARLQSLGLGEFSVRRSGSPRTRRYAIPAADRVTGWEKVLARERGR